MENAMNTTQITEHAMYRILSRYFFVVGVLAIFAAFMDIADVNTEALFLLAAIAVLLGGAFQMVDHRRAPQSHR